MWVKDKYNLDSTFVQNPDYLSNHERNEDDSEYIIIKYEQQIFSLMHKNIILVKRPNENNSLTETI